MNCHDRNQQVVVVALVVSVAAAAATMVSTLSCSNLFDWDGQLCADNQLTGVLANGLIQHLLAAVRLTLFSLLVRSFNRLFVTYSVCWISTFVLWECDFRFEPANAANLFKWEDALSLLICISTNGKLTYNGI